MQPTRPAGPHRSRKEARPGQKARKKKLPKMSRRSRRVMRRLYSDAKRRRRNQKDAEDKWFEPPPENNITEHLEEAQNEVYKKMQKAKIAVKPKGHKARMPSSMAFDKPLYEYWHDIPEEADRHHVTPAPKSSSVSEANEHIVKLNEDAIRLKERWHDRMFDPPVQVTFQEVVQQIKMHHDDHIMKNRTARRPSVHTPRQESQLTLDKTFSEKEEREQNEERRLKKEKAMRKKAEMEQKMGDKKNYEQEIYKPEALRIVPDRVVQKLSKPADVFEAKRLRHTAMTSVKKGYNFKMPEFEPHADGRRASQENVVPVGGSERTQQLYEEGDHIKKNWWARPYDAGIDVSHQEAMKQVSDEIAEQHKPDPNKPEPHYPRQISSLELDTCWSAKLAKEQEAERASNRKVMLVKKKENEDRLKKQKDLHQNMYDPKYTREVPDDAKAILKEKRDIFEDKKIAQYMPQGKLNSPRTARRGSQLEREKDAKHAEIRATPIRAKHVAEQKKRMDANPRGGGGLIKNSAVTQTVLKAAMKFKRQAARKKKKEAALRAAKAAA